MTKEPLVSIVIPVYNGSNYLSDAIESAIAQSYPNIEILVINDGSDDGGATRAVAQSYADKISYYEKENGGVSSALNMGIREMKGEFFSWLSHDDLYTSDKVAVQAEYLEKSGLDCCYSDFFSFGENIEEAQKIECDPFQMPESLFNLFGIGTIMGCTFLIRKTVFEEIGLFREDLKYTQDVEMWIRIFSSFKSHKINRCLVYQRGHDEQGSRVFQSEINREARSMYLEAILSEKVMVQFKKHLAGNETDIKAKVLTWLGKRLLRLRKDYKGFFVLYSKAIKIEKSYIIDFIRYIPLFVICMIRVNLRVIVNQLR